MGIERKLSQWREAGLIDAATAEAIARFERGRRRPTVLYALLGLGALTIGIGVVSVVAANWEGIPAAVKLGLDLALLSAFAAGVFVSVERRRPLLLETLVLIYYAVAAASLALVGQVYQLSTPMWQGLLLWSAVTTPLMLLARGRFAGALWLCGLGLTYAVSVGEALDTLNRRLDDAVFGNVLATIVFCTPWLFLALAAALARTPERASFADTFRRGVWLALWVLGFAPTFLFYDDLQERHVLSWGLLSALAVTALGAASLRALWPSSSARERLAVALCLGVIWLVCVMGTAFPREEIPAASAIAQLAYLAALAHAAGVVGRMHAFHAITAAIALRVLIAYFEVFGSMLSTGVAMITGGALTLAMAWLWRRKSASLADQLARPGGAGPAQGGGAR